jgi:hypothetical protein
VNIKETVYASDTPIVNTLDSTEIIDENIVINGEEISEPEITIVDNIITVE